MIVAAALYATLPTGFLAGHATSGVFGVARYAIPILVVILLGPLALSIPRGVAGRPFVEFGTTFGVTRRVASVAVIALLSIGLLSGLVACFAPRWLKPVFIGLSLLSAPIGMVVSEITLLLMFALVFWPIGLCFRLLRRDALQLAVVPKTNTYWRPKAQPKSVSSYYRQW